MTLPVFPTFPGLTWPVDRTAIWKTQKHVAVSGKETRLGTQWLPRWQWSLNFDALREFGAFSEISTLLGFYNQLGAGLSPFLFSDPNDCAVSGQIIGVGDGTTAAFQLVRAYGGFIEPIYAVNGAQSFAVGGTLATPTISASGVATFGSAPAAGASVVWSGAFYWLCRFDDDTLAPSRFGAGWAELRQLKFTSIKL